MMILEYLTKIIFRFIQFFISIIFFPIVYPFRKKAYTYTKNNKKFHILTICNWFFTKDNDNGDYYVGPYWYKKEFKDKIFNKYTDESKQDPIAETFKQKLAYFFLAYLWCGFRNYMWNLNRSLFTEGQMYFLDNRSYYKEKVNTVSKAIDSKDLMPQCKFKDKSGYFRDNKGPMIAYPGDFSLNNKCTIEGLKIKIFNTLKYPNRKRFQLNYAKVLKFIYFISLEFFIGWDYLDGQLFWHSKIMFTKINRQSRLDYYNYKSIYGK